MTIPTLKVEMAFGSGFSTSEGSRTWTDVTAYVAGALGGGVSSYGRSDEQSQPSPNTWSRTFENSDGRFTPGYASSPYYPNVVKGVPVRESYIYGGVTYVRYVGYVNEWPVEWPTGGDNYSTVTVTATSRRARLGQSAPLPSAIRAANLAFNPHAYWPMDEDTGPTGDENTDVAGQFIFRDITNPIFSGQRSTQYMAAFFPSDGAIYLQLHDGTPGPTDETSLVHFPSRSSTNLDRYIGGAGRMKIGTDVFGEAVVSLVARVSPNPANIVYPVLAQIWSADGSQTVYFFLYDNSRVVGGGQSIGVLMEVRDPATGAVIDSPGWSVAPGVDGAAMYRLATDGEIHHYYADIGFGTVDLYLDGVWVAVCELDAGFSFTKPFTDIAIGEQSISSDLWIGHVMVDDAAHTPTEIATLAAASIAASETIGARVTRLATYLGVPAAEIDTSTSIAAALGPQAELGQSASSVLDAVATSTGGVLYDGRDGHLKMTARNDRYTSSSLVTLSTSGDEIEADLKIQYDDRYLVNTVEVTRAGSTQSAPLTFTDAASIAAYGVYTLQTTMVSSSDDEAEAYGRDVLYRYAQPKVRVSQVTVDVCDLSISQRAAVLALDIGSKLTLSGLPLQAGASSMVVFVEGYSESYATTGKHLITFNTTPVAGYPSMAVVGTATVGSSTLVVY